MTDHANQMPHIKKINFDAINQGWRRILLYISYDGTAYCGWQRQQNAKSIQQTIEEALYKCTREHIVIHGASRTDGGVHATGQAAHFDTRCSIPAHKFAFVLNTLLPWDIRIIDSKEISPVEHARFSARGKTYIYRVHNSRHASALYRHIRAHVPVPIDINKIQRASQQILGVHDFAAFAASGSIAKSTIRYIHSISITKCDEEIKFKIMGNAFLYNMVRILAGTLIDIGQGKLEEKAIKTALDTGNRLVLGVTAPAHGLELARVYYPWDEDFVPMRGPKE